jgi:hypothetical protein
MVLCGSAACVRGLARRGGAAAALLLALLVAPAAADMVPLHLVPRPVVDAVRARFRDARISAVEKDLQDGHVVYEVAVRDGGRRLDVIVTPGGTVRWIKTMIPPRALPAAVTGRLEERYPGAVYQEVEKVLAVEGGRETLAGYEVVLLTARKAIVEVQIDPEGKLLTRAWR